MKFILSTFLILKLGQELEFDDNVHAVCVACLKNQLQTEPTGSAIIAGWGNQNGWWWGYKII
jgi:hypothetical protein